MNEKKNKKSNYFHLNKSNKLSNSYHGITGNCRIFLTFSFFGGPEELLPLSALGKPEQHIRENTG